MKKQVKMRGKSPMPERVREPEVLEGKGGPTEAGVHTFGSTMRCFKAHQLEVVRGVTVPMAQIPSHYAQGIEHHAQRARWFARRFKTDAKTIQECHDAGMEAAEEQKLPMSQKDIRKAFALFDVYAEYWSKLPLPKPVAAEYKLGPAPVQKDDPFYFWRTARLDDVSAYVESDYKLVIGESKTTSGSVHDVVREYEMHPQTALQLVLWDMCPNGKAKYGPVAGIMIDATKKANVEDGEKPAFLREMIRVTPFMLEWARASLRHYLKIAVSIDWDSDVPRNLNGCTYMAGRARVDCTFKKLCQYGADATASYIMRDGSSLKRHKPEPGRMKMPWE